MIWYLWQYTVVVETAPGYGGKIPLPFLVVSTTTHGNWDFGK